MSEENKELTKVIGLIVITWVVWVIITNEIMRKVLKEDLEKIVKVEKKIKTLIKTKDKEEMEWKYKIIKEWVNEGEKKDTK